MSSDLQFHDAANIFPLLTGDDFDALVEDIRNYGLREPVALLDGKILDGRNRYRACLLANVKCESEEVKTDDPIAYVLSLNKHRRHLTPTQLAMVAAKAREVYDRQAKERQKLSEGRGKKGMVNMPYLKGSSRDAAGHALGVSGKLVDHASKVLRNGSPELIEAIEQDRIAVSTAARLMSQPADLQKRVLASATKGKRRPRPTESDLPKTEVPTEPGKLLGVGVLRANEAIDALKRIPKNDALRKRGFQIVTDWIKANK